MIKRRYTVSVRRLVEFILRTGDLAGGRGRSFTANRAAEGMRGHQTVQRSRSVDYESEVPVKHLIESADFTIEIKGRIDGLIRRDDTVLIEEIKTTYANVVSEPDPLHLSQAKVYGAIFAAQNSLKHIALQVSYFHLESGDVTPFRQMYSSDDLQSFLDKLGGEYLEWIENLDKWRVIRNASVEALEFPFSPYRGGQRELAVAVYRALSNGKTLFAQAPTGIGKTVSVLFPAIKRLPSGDAEKIFYLTAKTIGRNVAENTISQLCNRGLRLRALTLTARDKICFAPPGGSCDMKTCAYAVGYYDRRKEALKELCALERLTREQVERVARKHQVCPFALSQDAAEWVDLIICDFNYAFDPSAMLRDFFGEDGTANFLLIDEAHNLPDRAREMFSAELASSQFASAISDPGTGHGCKASLKKCLKAFQNLTNVLEFEAEAIASNAPPDKLAVTLRAFLEKAEQNLAEETSASSLETLRETYFAVLRFVRVLDNFDLSYQTIYRNESEHIRIKLFCIDPARSLLPILRESKGTVFFSATLAPLDYYRRLLAGQLPSEVLELASPFPSENLPVFVESRVATNFKERARTYATVAESIVQLVRAKRGNYLAFFPSYKYLEAVLAVVQLAAPDLAVVVQRSSMNESDRAQFMAHFDCENIQTLIGFAVMGGVFSEGIDLVGDRLVGAIVVGVGLPQISLERNLITNYFAALGQNGFNYGYVFPGMNRVLQAVGRVIRSETDRGVALLIDERFARWPYRELLPRWWDLKPMQRDTPLSELVSRYWETPLS